MSDIYELERQNEALLDNLANKVTTLRSATFNVYNTARDHSLIEESSQNFSSLSTSLTGSLSRLTRTARAGNKYALVKLTGFFTICAFLLYWLSTLLFSTPKE